MSYLVLARKFRPGIFDEVIGQEHISQTLKNAIAESRVAHAYLFSGPRGVGKTTMARVLAKSLNCQKGPTSNPCGICVNCLEISKSASVDVFEIDGASNNGIDEIRALRENVKFSTASSKYKIYIIDEAHQITTQAFNALLKTLEEPPEHVVFILATTEQHKIPVTILSRCQRYRFKLLNAKEISAQIKSIAVQENFEIDEDAIAVIINASGGSMRDALSLLEQAVSSSGGKVSGEYIRSLLGLLPQEIISKTTQSLASGDIYEILKIVKTITEDGYNALQFARDLRDHLRQLMLYSISPDIASSQTEDKQLLEKQKDLFTPARHVRLNNLLSKALEDMRWHDSPRILLEMYLTKMAEPYYNIAELISKIAELERKSGTMEDDFSAQSQTAPAEFVAGIAAEAASADLLVVWHEILADIVKKHPLSSQSLKTSAFKITGPASVMFSAKTKFDLDGVLEFKEIIEKMFERKTGIAVSVKAEVSISNATPQAAQVAVKEEIIIEEELSAATAPKAEYKVEEDLKETAKTALPKKIEDIAKKFGAKAVKKIG
ncbi:MAG: DNA polymerase III subunit gamma/tau [Elusimicrobia bacterium]|nr:DNA polymerase III subunit gamma/tau [Elusimicrobiota bacterium]